MEGPPEGPTEKPVSKPAPDTKLQAVPKGGSRRFELMDYHQFSSTDWGAVRWLVDRLIPRVGCGFLAAAPKLGKTWLALDLAMAVSSGSRFLGRLTEIGTAVYIGGEGGASTLQRRLSWLVAGRRLQPSHFAERAFMGINSRFQIDKPGGIQELRLELDRVEPSLIIFDPFTRFHSRRENERDSIEPVLNTLRRLSEEYQAFVLMVHHAPKPSKEQARYDPLRGSSAMRAWHDGLIWLEQGPDFLLLQAELRDAEPPAPLEIELDIDEAQGLATVDFQGQRLEEDDQIVIEAIKGILREKEQSTLNDLVKTLRKGKAKTARMISGMEDLGLVTRKKVTLTRANGRPYETEVFCLQDPQINVVPDE